MDSDPGAAAEAFRFARLTCNPPKAARDIWPDLAVGTCREKFTEAIEQYSRRARGFFPRITSAHFALGRASYSFARTTRLGAEEQFREADRGRMAIFRAPSPPLGLANAFAGAKRNMKAGDRWRWPST